MYTYFDSIGFLKNKNLVANGIDLTDSCHFQAAAGKKNQQADPSLNILQPKWVSLQRMTPK
jgi:hypothetical protein